MMKKDRQKTTLVKADLHKVTMPLIDAMHLEFKELSKKKPEAVLSKNKVKIVNRLLESCRKVLDSETSLNYLDLIDEDDIPQNSDVVLMLSQYVAAMMQFKSTYYGSDGLYLRWFTE
ncbi:MAG: hypothetical protein V7L14_13405 [Nostoc sp.]|uniref:hypothetical protein n=1 Tax=Nostoc sp. TaxID=1180 RepID=UPI002FF5C024